MAQPFEVISVLVALEFVAMAAIVLLLGPLEAVVSVVPLMVVLLIALVVYWR
ncbi:MULTISPECIES: hypothetical protein [Haloferax]|uniref:hypothetical protein n=1 Tax=Haloferax TaxID=2251 RepID=UPI00177B6BBB|nr:MULTISPECIES: hypothetical protein [Haloferax]